jgi:DNA-binding GntR family transcriptional regulator
VKKFKRNLASERVYSQLKQMILSGKLKKGKNLMQDEIAQSFNVSKMAAAIAFSHNPKGRVPRALPVGE